MTDGRSLFPALRCRYWLARGECVGAHKTGPIIWPGTAHQHVVCEDCKRRLPV